MSKGTAPLLTNRRVDRVLAFDFGRSAGWGCVDREGALVGAGNWTIPTTRSARTGRKTMPDEEREHPGRELREHQIKMSDVLWRVKPSHLVFSFQVGRGNSAEVVKKHGEYRGILRLMTYAHPCGIYSFGEWAIKATAAGYGAWVNGRWMRDPKQKSRKMDKTAMMHEAMHRWGADAVDESEDQADACWCAETGRILLLAGEVLTGP